MVVWEWRIWWNASLREKYLDRISRAQYKALLGSRICCGTLPCWAPIRVFQILSLGPSGNHTMQKKRYGTENCLFLWNLHFKNYTFRMDLRCFNICSRMCVVFRDHFVSLEARPQMFVSPSWKMHVCSWKQNPPSSMHLTSCLFVSKHKNHKLSIFNFLFKFPMSIHHTLCFTHNKKHAEQWELCPSFLSETVSTAFAS